MTTAPTSAPLAPTPDAPLRRGFMASALAALFVLTLRQNVHGRRLLVLVLLFVLPVVLAAAVQWVAFPPPPGVLEYAFVFTLIPHALAPLTALLYGAGVIQDEVEEQTLTYLLLRPLPRWAMYVTRLLAAWLTTTLLTCIFTTLTLIVIYWNTPELWSDVLPRRVPIVAGLMALAQVGYCSLFGVFGLLTRRALFAGLAYIIGFEWMLANFDAVVRQSTVMYYFRVLALHRLKPSGTEQWKIDLTTAPTVENCLWTLLGVSALFVLMGALRMQRQEFRMKTAEGP